MRTCSRSFWGRTSALPGWDARRGVQPIAQLLAIAATPQTARKDHCPQGWSEIGRLDTPAACMGMGPCGAPEASTHPDCAPTRSPERPSADSATFNLTQEFADATTTLAANQGLYNGFLAAGLFFGLFTGNRVFKIFLGSHKCVAGRPARGWDARRGVQPIARLLANAATPQTARQDICPKGWSEIGRLDAPAACVGTSPCGASKASTHPDCTPMRSPKKTLNRF